MDNTEISTDFTREDLIRYVDRIEALEREKKEIAEVITDVLNEAKSNGFDTKALRQVIKLRKMDRNELERAEAMVELYRSVLESGNRRT